MTFVPGVTPQELQRPASSRFAADAGKLLRALHSFPVDKALRLGLPLEDGPTVRENQTARYESVIRRVFPLISCEARSYCAGAFEAYLNNEANFRFEPRLVHYDFDQRNTLVDPLTGDLCGLVDFGGCRVSDPAGDFVWLLSIGLRDLGIEDQRDTLLTAYDPALRFEDLQPRVDYYYFWWPLEDILHGLDIEDEDFVAEGIRALNERVPFGTKC
jgi:aminoglycoside phosphotransferase (APT) family kinase protein